MAIFDINGQSNQQQQPPTAKVNVNVNDAPELKCSNCGDIFFQEVTFFKKLSALVSPTGKETLIPISTFTCINCGNINPELLPVKLSNYPEPSGDNNG